MSNVRPGAFGLPALARRAWSYRRVAAVAGAKGSSSAGNVLFQFFLITTLPLAAVGEVNYVIALAMGIGVFVRGGMDMVLTRDASYFWRSDQRGLVRPLFFKTIASAAIRAVAILVLLLSLTLIFPLAISRSMILFAVALAVLFTFLLLSSSVLKSVEEIVLGSWVEQGQPFLLAGGAGLILFVMIDGRASPYELLLVCATVVTAFSAMLLFRKTRGYSSGGVPVSLGKERSLFLISFSSYVSQWGVILLMHKFYDEDDLGLFSSALRFGLALNFLLMVSNQFVVPRISTLFKRNEISKLENLVRRTATYLMFAGIILIGTFSIALCFVDSQALKGVGFASIVILCGQLVNVSSGATGYVLALTGNEKLWLISSVAGTLCGVAAICIVGAAGGNILHAVLAYSSIPIVITVVSVAYIKRVFGFYSIPKLW